MYQVTVHEAKTRLSRLLREVVEGEDVVITRSGRPVARLVPVGRERPVFGVDEGRFVVPDDFDEGLLRAFEGRQLAPRQLIRVSLDWWMRRTRLRRSGTGEVSPRYPLLALTSDGTQPIRRGPARNAG